MHTGSRPKEWNATGDLGTNHSVGGTHEKGGQDRIRPGALGAASTLVKTPPPNR